MSRAKYPDECPVFSVSGRHVELRPFFCGFNELDPSWLANASRFRLGDAFAYRPRDVTPLTAAARKLLAWSRG